MNNQVIMQVLAAVLAALLDLIVAKIEKIQKKEPIR